jgi:drug/metabolite transporter (DMT)-like permease
VGELAALASALCWAFASIVFTRLADAVDSVAANAYRCFVATLTFGLLLFFSGGPAILQTLTLEAILRLTISVWIIIGMGDTLFFKSMRLIGVSRAMPIANTNPLITTALAMLFLGERLTILQIAGSVLTVLGLILITSSDSKNQEGMPPLSRRGVGIALATALCWGVGTVIMKSGLTDLDPLVVNCVRQPAALIFLLGVLATRKSGFRQTYARMTLRTWIILTLASIIASTIGSQLFVMGVQLAGAARGGVLASTAALFSLPFSIFLLHEKPSSRVITATFVTIAGIALLVWRL